MIKVNEPNKLTPKIKTYYFLYILFIIIFTSITFSMSGANFFQIALVVIIFLGIPFSAIGVWVYNSFSFLLKESDISIYSGIIIKRTKMIPLNTIQSIDCKQGILMRILKIKKLNIWTSSPSQININQGNTINTPDCTLFLSNEDSVLLQELINSLKKK